MRLRDLHAQLGDLVAAGHGDALVIDEDGNDAARVHGPYDDEDVTTVVMLSLYIDHDLRKEVTS